MWDRIRPWIFPVACIGCDAPGRALCVACMPSPAQRVTDTVANAPVSAAGRYEGILRRAIVAMKHGERDYLDPFSALLAELIPGPVPLVPLPTTGPRRRARGFDQGIELARRAAIRRGCPVYDVLAKHGFAQRGRSRSARLAFGGQFCIKAGSALPELALVVDDVCTTGATLTDGIATLRAAGVAVIGAVVLARTAPGRNSRPSTVVMRLDSIATPRRTNMKAIWNGTVIAESDATEVVEGNHYFPATAIKSEFFHDSTTHSTCPWKGVASYYTVEVDGKKNPDAAWFYPTPKDAAKNITGYVAFWKGVEVAA